MKILNVLVAALAAFAADSVWYGILAEPWKEVSGVPLGPDGNPTNASRPMTYVIALAFTILVAWMMRHIFVLGDRHPGQGTCRWPWERALPCHAVEAHPLSLFRKTAEIAVHRQ